MTVFFAQILWTFWRAYLAMLILGMLHHEADSRIPALGYWATFGVALVAWYLTDGRLYNELPRAGRDE
jgi:hypothetical protein